MRILRWLRQTLCWIVRGHDPNVENVLALWGRTRWCVVCRRCQRVLEIL